MERITLEQIRQAFADTHAGWCVSCTCRPIGQDGRWSKDPHLRNLLRQAEEELRAEACGQRRSMPCSPTPRPAPGHDFWQHPERRAGGLFSEDLFAFRVPLPFAELAVVTGRFHLKPLLPLLTSDGTFSVLAVSQNDLRLLVGTRHTMDSVELADVPRRLVDTLPEGYPERQLQLHTGTPAASGGRAAVFHGHDISNDIKTRLQQWFRTIDREGCALLADSTPPLVLAGVESLYPLYREISGYPRLMDTGIAGNPENMTPEELHARGWEIVEPVFAKNRGTARARYHQLVGTGQTSTDVAETVAAAGHGRVEVLFVAVGVQVWGRIDRDSDEVALHPARNPVTRTCSTWPPSRPWSAAARSTPCPGRGSRRGVAGRGVPLLIPVRRRRLIANRPGCPCGRHSKGNFRRNSLCCQDPVGRGVSGRYLHEIAPGCAEKVFFSLPPHWQERRALSCFIGNFDGTVKAKICNSTFVK